jgi:hypothetical protein
MGPTSIPFKTVKLNSILFQANAGTIPFLRLLPWNSCLADLTWHLPATVALSFVRSKNQRVNKLGRMKHLDIQRERNLPLELSP